MTQPTFTPGPWVVGKFLRVLGSPDKIGTSRLVCSVDGTNGEPNANLITAAPEMYGELAEFIIEMCEACEGSGRSTVQHEDACHDCGGFGSTISGGDPIAILEILARARGETVEVAQ